MERVFIKILCFVKPKGEIPVTKNRPLACKIYSVLCLAMLVLCLCNLPSIANEKETVEKNTPHEDGVLDLIKKQNVKLTPLSKQAQDESFTEYYGSAIGKALEKLGIKKIYLDMLRHRYPDSALSKLKDMTDSQKLDVAAGILFIKKACYGKVSNGDIIRESAAIVYYANKYKVTSSEAFAMADLESHCIPKSVGRHNRVLGPFQVHWKVHSDTLLSKKIVSSREDMFDADKGVHAGVYVFAGYVHAAGSVRKSLQRYLGTYSKRYINRFFQRANKFKKIREELKKSL